MPTTPAGVRAVLLHYATMTYCLQHHTGSCTEGELIWGEALSLLQDPVSTPVRSATFKVMASLPGVRMLGPMTDPLGRQGYGLDGGPDVVSQGVDYNPVSASWTNASPVLPPPSMRQGNEVSPGLPLLGQ
jgi:hypothetical protein